MIYTNKWPKYNQKSLYLLTFKTWLTKEKIRTERIGYK